MNQIDMVKPQRRKPTLSPWRLLLVAPAALLAACATPLQRPATVGPRPSAGLADQKPAPRHGRGSRPAIGVAFGGGSARGLAHVGVIRWFEEHRIPIDLVAGHQHGRARRWRVRHRASTPPSSTRCWARLDWDELFNSSDFAAKNIRRKADARAFPPASSSG